jgi:predicted RNA-binding protein with PUA-like domain
MWLLKTEPSEYAYADLERDGRATWDGIRNPVALRNLGQMRAGDRAVVYHTGAERAAVGIARVTQAAYPDPAVRDPKRLVVDLEPLQRLARPVSLARIKSLPVFADSPLLRQGRLSVVPLSDAQWAALERESR